MDKKHNIRVDKYHWQDVCSPARITSLIRFSLGTTIPPVKRSTQAPENGRTQEGNMVYNYARIKSLKRVHKRVCNVSIVWRTWTALWASSTFYWGRLASMTPWSRQVPDSGDHWQNWHPIVLILEFEPCLSRNPVISRWSLIADRSSFRPYPFTDVRSCNMSSSSMRTASVQAI